MLARDEEEVAGEQEEGGAPGEPLEAHDRGVVADFDSSPRWTLRVVAVAGKDGGGGNGGAGAWEENERVGLG